MSGRPYPWEASPRKAKQEKPAKPKPSEELSASTGEGAATPSPAAVTEQGDSSAGAVAGSIEEPQTPKSAVEPSSVSRFKSEPTRGASGGKGGGQKHKQKRRRNTL